MKRLVLSLACLSALGFAGSATAEPPHGKSTIRHCGCVLDVDDNVGMAYVEISVSSKAKGHGKHAAGTIDSCVDANGGLVDIRRTGSDCYVSGAPLGELVACTDTQAINSSCGEVVEQ